jgi:squalene cyclase
MCEADVHPTEATLWDERCLEWLISCKHQRPHGLTETNAGGWSWTDASGAVPTSEDTAAALLAIWDWRKHATERQQGVIDRAAMQGLAWLLSLQNDDGGWPLVCRGDDAHPAERSAVELTSLAVRALNAWSTFTRDASSCNASGLESSVSERAAPAVERGLQYLRGQARADGSFSALWFGNTLQDQEENLVYGTASVLSAFVELELKADPVAQAAARWLVRAQLVSGGWGPAPPSVKLAGYKSGRKMVSGDLASVEETSLALLALYPMMDLNDTVCRAAERGLAWLAEAIENGRHRRPAPIARFLSRAWYAEKLYPRLFAAAAISSALQRHAAESVSISVA